MHDDSPPDNELISRCQAGDEDAFEVLYSRYRLQLYSYLNKLLPGRAAEVDDLYQQVWIKVLDNLRKYRHQQRFISWLFRIAHNMTIDLFRREARRETVELSDNVDADEPMPWVELDRNVIMERLDSAIADLTPEQREVVLMRRRGIAFKEIAEIQDASVNTVLGRMHYAVKKLRLALSELV